MAFVFLFAIIFGWVYAFRLMAQQEQPRIAVAGRSAVHVEQVSHQEDEADGSEQGIRNNKDETQTASATRAAQQGAQEKETETRKKENENDKKKEIGNPKGNGVTAVFMAKADQAVFVSPASVASASSYGANAMPAHAVSSQNAAIPVAHSSSQNANYVIQAQESFLPQGSGMPVAVTSFASQGSVPSFYGQAMQTSFPVPRSQIVGSNQGTAPFFGSNQVITPSFGSTDGIAPSFGSNQVMSNTKYATSLSGPGVSSLASATSFDGSRKFQSCQARIGLWKQMEMNPRSIKRGALLGQGAYAEVYKGQASDVECAIKVYRKTASAKHLEEARREIKLAASLDHPCTLRVLGWTRQPLQTITELCCGDLKAFYLDKIEAMKYSEWQALRLLKVGHGSRSCLLWSFQFSLQTHVVCRNLPLASSASTRSELSIEISNRAISSLAARTKWQRWRTTAFRASRPRTPR